MKKMKSICVLQNEVLNSKKDDLSLLNKSLENTNKEIESYKVIKNDSISEMEENLINEYNKKNTLKDKLTLDSKNLSIEIDKLKQEIEERTASDKLKNNSIRNLEKEIKEVDINITRIDVKLDTMLNTLNDEYSLTFERAKKEYILDLEVEEARKKEMLIKLILNELVW